MYQPTLNRFASRDPLSADGVDVIPNTGWFGERLTWMRQRYGDGAGTGPTGDLNLYRYVGNNPGNFVDPSGLQAEPHVPLEAPPAAAAACCCESILVKKSGMSPYAFPDKVYGGGKDLGYVKGIDDFGDTYFNLRFVVTVTVKGDVNKCTYKQTADRESNWSGRVPLGVGPNTKRADDTQPALTKRPLMSDDNFVSIDGNKVIWIDAPGLADLRPNMLPAYYYATFVQSCTGSDGKILKVTTRVRQTVFVTPDRRYHNETSHGPNPALGFAGPALELVGNNDNLPQSAMADCKSTC